MWIFYCAKIVLDIGVLVDKFNLDGLKGKAEVMITNKFQWMVQEDEFLNVKVETLKWLLQNDDIYIDWLIDSIDWLIRWIEVNKEVRKSHFSDLVTSVRIQHIRPPVNSIIYELNVAFLR